MHHHCEIVLPPGSDVEECVESAMAQFNENKEDPDECDGHEFWDFYVIGGRFSGSKMIASFDPAKVSEFYAWMESEKVTVSGFTAGKQEIAPASQIPKVDAKWREFFPDTPPGVGCPLFKHSSDQYGKGMDATLPGDICRLSEVPTAMKVEKIIFAGPDYNIESKTWDGAIEATHIVERSFWNGVNHQDTQWDGTLSSALADFRENLSRMSPDYAKVVGPQDDWLVVTVDYHS